MTDIINSIKKSLKEWWNVLNAPLPSDIAKECREEFYDEITPKTPLIERFYIKKQGRYNPVEIRDRLRHDVCIVRVNTESYRRDQFIAEMVFDMFFKDYKEEF